MVKWLLLATGVVVLGSGLCMLAFGKHTVGGDTIASALLLAAEAI
jgi:hypothetical protein